MNGSKKLYRIEKGAYLAGVCGGVAEYLNVDVNLVRLAWVLITLCTRTSSMIFYLAAALLLPKKGDVYPGY